MKKKNLHLISAITIGTAIIAATSYCVWKMNKDIDNTIIEIEQNGNNTSKVHYIDITDIGTEEVSEKTQYKIIESKKTNCEDILDTSCWNTFVNEEYGYQIKYPKNWDMRFHLVNTTKGQVMHIGPSYEYDAFYANDPYYAPLEISVFDGNGQSFDDWHKSIYSHPVDIAKLKEAQRITHNNVNFVVFNDESVLHYFAVKNDQFINFNLVDSFINEEQGKKIMEAMVFSSEFLD